jgi:hypothetical protein
MIAAHEGIGELLRDEILPAVGELESRSGFWGPVAGELEARSGGERRSEGGERVTDWRR